MSSSLRHKLEEHNHFLLLASITVRKRQNDKKHCESFLKAKTTITRTGGVLEIPKTGVVLVVPPNALPEHMEQCEMQIRIITRTEIKEQVTSFSANSSTVVELLPDSLIFERPVRLKLPHCLVLHETIERKARIFVSHHREGSPPQWEEQTHLSYHLEDTTCIIQLDSLCWVKYSINDEIVKAKKLVVYTAARKLQPVDKVAEIRVGYYLDLPDEKMVCDAREVFVAHRKTFYYVKRKEKYPLRVSLDNIFPSGWHYYSKKPVLREIAYGQIVSFFSCSVIYTLKKKGSTAGNPLCVFTVSQENGQIPVQLAAHLKVIEKDPLPARHMEHSFQCLEQCEAPLKSEKTITRAGGTLKISDSDIRLEIPPNALPPHMDQCLVRMTVIPSRIVEDQVTSLCSNSSTAVEISPSNLTLQCSAKLTLPHCLMFKKTKGRNARIFINEEEGSPSPWKERRDLECELKENACIVHLGKLCCVKYSIDDTIVKAKRIAVYTAAKSVKQADEHAEVEVGYYSDIPGGCELLRLNPNVKVDFETKLLFMEKQKFALELLLDQIAPSHWKCCIPNKNPQEIPYKVIASSIEHSHLYVLQKGNDRPGSVMCQFIASQRESHMSSELSVKLCPQQEDQAKGTVRTQESRTDGDHMTVLFQNLSQNLGSEWLDVGRKLGLQDAELNHIQADYPNRRQETIYQMLLLWKQTRGSDATYNNLIKALKRSRRRDLAEKV